MPAAAGPLAIRSYPQTCAGPDPLHYAGLPVQFDGLDIVNGDVERALQAGDMVIAR